MGTGAGPQRGEGVDRGGPAPGGLGKTEGEGLWAGAGGHWGQEPGGEASGGRGGCVLVWGSM